MSEINDERSALDALNQTNRLLVEARMLPENKALTAAMIFAVIDRFEKYITERDIKLAQVAREIGYTDSVLSQWKGNTYKGDVDGITRAINVWLERSSRREEASKPKGYISTWVAETLRTIAFQADKRLMMAAIVAPAGAGKTMVLQALTEQMRGIYVYVPAGISEREFLLKLAAAVDRGPVPRTKGELTRLIVEKLKGTKRILFLDEAHNLGAAVRCVRSIHDQAGVPVLMAGTADVLSMVNDRADGRGQFSSRTIRCNLLDFVASAEDPDGNAAGRPLFTIQEVKQFFATRGIRLADDALRMMWALACLPNYGTLRLVGHVADIASDVNRGAEMLTRQQLLGALQMLVGGEARHLKTLAERFEQKAKVA